MLKAKPNSPACEKAGNDFTTGQAADSRGRRPASRWAGGCLGVWTFGIRVYQQYWIVKAQDPFNDKVGGGAVGGSAAGVMIVTRSRVPLTATENRW